MSTKIEWTEATWNPVAGCTPVSAGCDNCYARRAMTRFPDRWPPADQPFEHVRIYPDRLEIPGRRKKPTMYFAPSMGDLFHADVPYTFQRDVFDVMNANPRHIFQVLTKRPELTREFWNRWGSGTTDGMWRPWPRNVWIGVTVEHQRHNVRIVILAGFPAPVRFVSYEPALGPLILPSYPTQPNPVHWLIVGCETGPGARKPDDAWLREIAIDTTSRGIPVFVKAWRIDGKVVKTPAFSLPGPSDGRPVDWRPRMGAPCTQYPAEAIAAWRRDYPEGR